MTVLDWCRTQLSESPLMMLLLFKTTLILSAAWLTDAWLQRANPRWRVLTWRMTLLGLLGLPFCHALSPPIVWTKPPVKPAIVDLRVDRDFLPTEQFASPKSPGPEAVIEEPARSPASTAAPWSASGICLSIYAMVALLLMSRTVVGWLGLRRITRASKSADPSLKNLLEEVQSALKVRRQVQVRVSAEVVTPLLSGLHRPVVLVPADPSRSPSIGDMPGVLAHELAHVRHSDLRWSLGLEVARILLWFHPLVWSMRAAHTAACEAVSDSVAATYIGSVHNYCQILARAAVRSATLPATSLGMARSSSVGRRIASLQRRLFGSNLPGRWLVLYLVVGSLLIAACSGLRLVAASPQEQGNASVAAAETPSESPLAHHFSETTGESVQQALAFLSARQQADGSFGDRALGDQRLAVTAICGLALLAEELHWKEGKYVRSIKLCRDYLIAQQTSEGLITGTSGLLYIHAYVIQFLAEVQLAFPDERTEQVLTRAVAASLSGQNEQDGWRYTLVARDADVSATACQLFALLAAERAGIDVSPQSLKRGCDYLARCQAEDGGFSYVEGNAFQSAFPRSAAAMAVLLNASHPAERSETVEQGVGYLRRQSLMARVGEGHFSYGQYYCCRALATLDDESFGRWYRHCREQLLASQLADRSWPPELGLGSEYSTASACIVLLSPHWQVKRMPAN